MSKYPITQEQWKAIALRADLKVNQDLLPEPSYFKEDLLKPFIFPKNRSKLDLPSYGNNPAHWHRPVEQINWYEAREFCARLSKLTGRKYRLPSEAEWEYACRAVTIDKLSATNKEFTLEEWNNKYYQPFHSGETITGEFANYYASRTYAKETPIEESKGTTPVGKFHPNAFGLYDMHGNVLEWCADDWHENYKGAPVDGSAWNINDDNNEKKSTKGNNNSTIGENGENERITTERKISALEVQEKKHQISVPLRAGSWNNAPTYCTSAYRYLNRAGHDYKDDNIGFRIVCSDNVL